MIRKVGFVTLSLIIVHITRVISSPSISTTGPSTLIFVCPWWQTKTNNIHEIKINIRNSMCFESFAPTRKKRNKTLCIAYSSFAACESRTMEKKRELAMYCVLQKENLESVLQLPPSFDTWGPETENKPQRGWVLGECRGVSRGMCYPGHGWSVIDSIGHICVAIKSFNSS